FDLEKNVIIEEIGMYEDQPMWSTYDHAKRIYFAEHPLGNSILGTPDSIRALKRDQMHAYFERRYVAPNIIVAAAGNYAWPRRLVAGAGGPAGAARDGRLGQVRGHHQGHGGPGARLPDRLGPARRLAAAARRRHAGAGSGRRLGQPALLGPGRSGFGGLGG